MEKEKLKVLKENAEKAYQAADANGKKLLQDLFPGVLVPINVMERINTWEDVLADHKLTEAEFVDMIENDTEDEAAYKRCKLIALSLNERPLRRDENWYMPVFNKTGFGFSHTVYVYWTTYATVGSRLLGFKSRELSDHAGSKFAHIYKPLI